MKTSFAMPLAVLFLALAAAAPAGAAAAGPLFARIDTDRDGAISPQEFRAGYATLQQAVLVESRLREQFRAGDRDRSGRLDPDEYSRLALVARRGASAPPLATFDIDRDGGLGFAEYVAAVAALAPPAPAPRKAAARPEARP